MHLYDEDKNLLRQLVDQVFLEYHQMNMHLCLLLCWQRQQYQKHSITNSSSAATNYTNVSTTAVFTDTLANTGAYSAGSIPETLDQPTTVTNYYLHRRDQSANTPSRIPLVIVSGNDLQEMSTATIDDVLGDWLRYTAGHSGDGYKITYDAATSGGNTRGTSMVDTKLNGSGDYQTLQVSDDYRSQEFPNGSAVTVTTYNLRINKGQE